MPDKVYVNRYRIENDQFVEKVLLTPGLLANIAKYNTYMTPAKCHEELTKGSRVYTSFSYYCKAPA